MEKGLDKIVSCDVPNCVDGLYEAADLRQIKLQIALPHALHEKST